MNTTPELSCDVLIIGSGAAGLSLALRLAEKHQVIVLSKGPVSEGSTFYAQGGIAAVFDETDSIDSHVEDTLIAGAGLCDRHAVEFVASNARTCVQWLIDQGVLFDTQVQPNGEESYHLTREGGHSHRRIIHAADATGHAELVELCARLRLAMQLDPPVEPAPAPRAGLLERLRAARPTATHPVERYVGSLR